MLCCVLCYVVRCNVVLRLFSCACVFNLECVVLCSIVLKLDVVSCCCFVLCV